MTQKEYLAELADLEDAIATEYLFDTDIAKKIVRKADNDYHYSCFEDVKTAAYELAYFVEDCIKAYNK